MQSLIGSEEVTAQMEVAGVTGDHQLKVFVWDSITGIRPVAHFEPAVFTVNGIVP